MGSDVAEPQFLEQQAGQQQPLDQFLGPAGQPLHLVADVGHLAQHPLGLLGDAVEELAGDGAVQVGRDRSHVLGDGHLVVVQDHQQIPLQPSCLLKPLHGEPRGQRAVADDAHHLVRLFPLLPGLHESHRGRHPGAGVAGVEGVVLALLALAESAQAVELPDGVELLLAPGQELVGVGLVARVPDDEVPGRVQQVVKGDGQLHHAEIRGEVPADVGYDRDDPLPDLLAELRELLGRQILEVRRLSDHR